MIQSVVRYLLTAGTALLASKGVLTEGQDLGSVTIEQAAILLATVGAASLWSYFQKKFFPSKVVSVKE